MVDDLFSSFELRETEFRNRLMVSPMCQYSVEAMDGVATPWHQVHLGSRASGGAGIVMAEKTAVEPRGRITPQDLGIWSEEHAEALRETTAFIKSQGASPGIQLGHAGRKASTSRPWEGHEPLQPDEDGWEVVAPSEDAWPYEEQDAPPMTVPSTDEVEDIVEQWREGAEHALDAGFEVAEIHGAHGYLLHQFLSPVTNHRDDKYGGSFENRARLILEVTEAVREVWPDDKPVFVRLSATDWLDDRESWDVEQTARLSDLLADAGADLVDVSSGGISPRSAPEWTGPNYQLALAEHVRENTETDIAVGTVGGITSPEQADAIIRNDRADLAIVGREFLRDPYFGLTAAAELGEDVQELAPVQYHRAFR
ncbi:NADH:flavin oxidoreductase/NADH oxidase [Halocalculus aciditolerans]|uniref:Oxidoreductase n=1 Tax=Halocalculus aciditolerans TaxID=1383812 RepID=A0A830F5T4_9EURY|nr:NADH:flavin oxidoreductase/NADH oxidase [Halocalculus aciditolerans]GGL57366.1 oxidoreductase [Halocalculus aciditolerans]